MSAKTDDRAVPIALTTTQVRPRETFASPLLRVIANVRFGTTCLATIAKGRSMPGPRLYDRGYDVARAGVRQGAIEEIEKCSVVVGVLRRYGD
jgi:hypothetical protein